MNLFKTKEEYLKKFEDQLNQVTSEEKQADLYTYMYTQFDQLNALLDDLSKETYWQMMPRILGIDAKLVLLTELVQLDEFSTLEILRIIETDYRTYYKELCGYDLSMDPAHSLIFNVS